jgi:hypothetical protein
MNDIFKLILETGTLVFKCFPSYSPRIWYAKLGSNKWSALVIDVVTKKQLARGEVCDTVEDCIMNLQSVLESLLQSKKPVPHAP